MNRRSKLAILLCLVLLAGGAAVFFWSSREPSLVDKAMTLRKGMTEEQVKAILGKPQMSLTVGIKAVWWRDGHNMSELVSRKPPYLHPVTYWNAPAWTIKLDFYTHGDGRWIFNNGTCYCWQGGRAAIAVPTP